jgi:hypothetical protein
MNTRDRVQKLRASDPDISGAVIAERLGISRQRAQQLLKELGLPTKTPARPRYHYREPREPVAEKPKWQRFAAVVCGPHVGAHAEMIACADLLERGFDVFRSISQAGCCDLIAASRTTYKTARVEVRAGNRRANGNLSVSRPARVRYDVLAVVLPHGEVVYSPQNSSLDTLDKVDGQGLDLLSRTQGETG